MDQKAVNERLKAAPNPLIDNYRKIVEHQHQQTMDTNHVGWRVLEYTVFKHRNRFFKAGGHWKSWKDTHLQSLARSEAETAVSIGVTLTQYWNGKQLTLIQNAMIKPYLRLSKRVLLGHD